MKFCLIQNKVKWAVTQLVVCLPSRRSGVHPQQPVSQLWDMSLIPALEGGSRPALATGRASLWLAQLQETLLYLKKKRQTIVSVHPSPLLYHCLQSPGARNHSNKTVYCLKGFSKALIIIGLPSGLHCRSDTRWNLHHVARALHDTLQLLLPSASRVKGKARTSTTPQTSTPKR